MLRLKAACGVEPGRFKSRFGQYLSLARSLVAVRARLEATPFMMDLANDSATETLRAHR